MKYPDLATTVYNLETAGYVSYLFWHFERVIFQNLNLS